MTLLTRSQVLQNIAKGLGWSQNPITALGGGGTAAAASSGWFSAQIYANAINSVLPNTIQSIPLPTGLTTNLNIVASSSSTVSARGLYLAYIYKLGTLALGATGEGFVHDAASFPVLRTQFGVANSKVVLTPMIQVSVAPTVTAPQFKIQNVTGPAVGYTNQDNVTVIGTKAFVFPSATTAIHTCFFPSLETATPGAINDSGILDISNINCTVAGTSSPACNVWGVEMLAYVGTRATPTTFVNDYMFVGLGMNDLNPAVATSGTATAKLVLITVGNSGNNGSQITISAVLNS